MKLKAYIKICLSLILLFAVNTIVLAQEANPITKESNDSIYQKKTGSQTEAVIDNKADSLLKEIQTRACVNTFTNQTVSTNVYVEGCNTLTVQNVTVASGGNLSLSAPSEVIINGTFDVLLGGVLNVGGGVVVPIPPGDNIQIPISIGTFGVPFQYTDTKNTSGYTNAYDGRPTNDVFYTFTLTNTLNVTINHCGSFGDTYLHLLNSSGTRIAYNDDYSGPGCCSNTSQAYLNQTLNAGTYYIVSEGSSSNGNIITNVTGTTPTLMINYTYDASGNRIARQ